MLCSLNFKIFVLWHFITCICFNCICLLLTSVFGRPPCVTEPPSELQRRNRRNWFHRRKTVRAEGLPRASGGKGRGYQEQTFHHGRGYQEQTFHHGRFFLALAKGLHGRAYADPWGKILADRVPQEGPSGHWENSCRQGAARGPFRPLRKIVEDRVPREGPSGLWEK